MQIYKLCFFIILICSSYSRLNAQIEQLEIKVDKDSKIGENIDKEKINFLNNIKKLKELGILIRHGSPKNGYWEVIDCGKKNNEDTE